MDRMNLWMVAWRTCCYTRCTFLSNSLMLRGGRVGWLTFLLTKSQMCSIRFRSGDFAGQSITRMLLPARNCWVVLARLQEALCCARIMPLLALICGTRTGPMMLSWYLLAVRAPVTRIMGVLMCIDTPAQTLIVPPTPNLSTSSTQAVLWCSPRQRYILFLSSELLNFILVSPTNKTFTQSALVNLKCLRAYAKQNARCLWLSTKPLLMDAWQITVPPLGGCVLFLRILGVHELHLFVL
jgi:hypothetical protein